MSPAKHPHTITPPPPCFTVGTTHAEIIRSPTLHLTKTRRLETKNSNLDSSDRRSDFRRSKVYCSCFLAQTSLFFLLVSFLVVVSLQHSCHEGLISCSVQLILRCVCYLNCYLKYLFGLQSEVQLILMNLSSVAEVTLGLPFLWWSSVSELNGFCDCT